jgi:hypothetical protein
MLIGCKCGRDYLTCNIAIFDSISCQPEGICLLVNIQTTHPLINAAAQMAHPVHMSFLGRGSCWDSYAREPVSTAISGLEFHPWDSPGRFCDVLILAAWSERLPMKDGGIFIVSLMRRLVKERLNSKLNDLISIDRTR